MLLEAGKSTHVHLFLHSGAEDWQGQIGVLKRGYLAGIVAVAGDPHGYTTRQCFYARGLKPAVY